MSDFGWQIFDGAGTLRYDHSSVMSRILGYQDIDIITSGLSSWSMTINNIAFAEGTPFAYCVPRAGLVIPSPYNYCYTPPIIYCGSNYLTAWYNARVLSFPDDVGTGVCAGGLTIVWGVYNG